VHKLLEKETPDLIIMAETAFSENEKVIIPSDDYHCVY